MYQLNPANIAAAAENFVYKANLKTSNLNLMRPLPFTPSLFYVTQLLPGRSKMSAHTHTHTLTLLLSMALDLYKWIIQLLKVDGADENVTEAGRKT